MVGISASKMYVSLVLSIIGLFSPTFTARMGAGDSGTSSDVGCFPELLSSGITAGINTPPGVGGDSSLLPLLPLDRFAGLLSWGSSSNP